MIKINIALWLFILQLLTKIGYVVRYANIEIRINVINLVLLYISCITRIKNDKLV